MKIETTPQVKRFNAAVEKADEATLYAFDVCSVRTLVWVLNMLGKRDERRQLLWSSQALENLKNGGEK